MGENSPKYVTFSKQNAKFSISNFFKIHLKLLFTGYCSAIKGQFRQKEIKKTIIMQKKRKTQKTSQNCNLFKPLQIITNPYPQTGPYCPHRLFSCYPPLFSTPIIFVFLQIAPYFLIFQNATPGQHFLGYGGSILDGGQQRGVQQIFARGYQIIEIQPVTYTEKIASTNME